MRAEGKGKERRSYFSFGRHRTGKERHSCFSFGEEIGADRTGTKRSGQNTKRTEQRGSERSGKERHSYTFTNGAEGIGVDRSRAEWTRKERRFHFCIVQMDRIAKDRNRQERNESDRKRSEGRGAEESGKERFFTYKHERIDHGHDLASTEQRSD